MRITFRGQLVIASIIGLSLGFFFPWDILPWNAIT